MGVSAGWWGGCGSSGVGISDNRIFKFGGVSVVLDDLSLPNKRQPDPELLDEPERGGGRAREVWRGGAGVSGGGWGAL